MDPGQSRSTSETLVLIGGFVLLVAFGYSINASLSPFVLAGALIYLLYPFRHSGVAARLLRLTIILFVFWFLYSILHLLTPFILAFLLAYMLDPLISGLERRKVPRWASSLLTVLVLIGIVIGAMLFVMPLVIQQFESIIGALAGIVSDAAKTIQSGEVFNVLSRYGIPVEKMQEYIGTQLSPRLESILKTFFETLFGFVSGFSSVVLQLINVIIIPFLLFYILKDLPQFLQWCTNIVPPGRRKRFLELSQQVDVLMGRYLRGAVLVAIIQGIISGIALWIIGVNYALVLGIMTGLLDFIPYIGLLTSLIVSSIVALFSGGAVATKVLAIVVVYLSQKLLEATVLGPKIIGSQVGLHPVLLILCLLVFGFFLGFVGMLIAVPATALIIAGLKEWERFRKQGEAAGFEG